jgi:hypothetical protein
MLCPRDEMVKIRRLLIMFNTSDRFVSIYIANQKDGSSRNVRAPVRVEREFE